MPRYHLLKEVADPGFPRGANLLFGIIHSQKQHDKEKNWTLVPEICHCKDNQT